MSFRFVLRTGSRPIAVQLWHSVPSVFPLLQVSGRGKQSLGAWLEQRGIPIHKVGPLCPFALAVLSTFPTGTCYQGCSLPLHTMPCRRATTSHVRCPATPPSVAPSCYTLNSMQCQQPLPHSVNDSTCDCTWHSPCFCCPLTHRLTPYTASSRFTRYP